MEHVMMSGCVRPEDSSVLRMTTKETIDNFAETLDRVADGENQVILNQDGKDVAAIVNIEEYLLLARVMEKFSDRIDLEAIRAGKKEAAPKITVAELKEALGLDVGDVTNES